VFLLQVVRVTSPAAFPAIKSPIRELVQDRLERSDSPPYSRGIIYLFIVI